jgi:hypothetical protein
MPINIDEINSDIISKIDRLLPLLKEKFYRKTPEMEAKEARQGGILNGVNQGSLRSVEYEKLVKPINIIRSAAQSNISSLNANLLDLDAFNALKPEILRRFVSNESELRAVDFPESERRTYRFMSIVRSIIRPLDYLLSFVTNYRLPKTTLELAWEALDDAMDEYNDALNLLKNDKRLKYKNALKKYQSNFCRRY